MSRSAGPTNPTPHHPAKPRDGDFIACRQTIPMALVLPSAAQER
jgi:hypothetical protein